MRKNSETNIYRKDLAHAIHNSRVDDAEKAYRLSRTKTGYEFGLELDDSLYDYISNLSSKKILDIGIGSGKALSDFCKDAKLRDKGFVFEGTYLTRKVLRDEIRSGVKLYQTPVERLKGVPESSYGAVLAYLSVAYSRFPDSAVESIDRVLVSGGIFVGKFSYVNHKSVRSKGSQTEFFAPHFKKRGYVVLEKYGYLLKAVKPPFNAEEVRKILPLYSIG